MIKAISLPAMFAGYLALLGLANCSPSQELSNREIFSRSCASAAEVQVQALNGYNSGVISKQAFSAITTAYSSVVDTCATLPASEDAAQIALDKVSTLLITMKGNLNAH